MSFLTLRDPSVLDVAAGGVLADDADRADPATDRGSRVVVHGRFEFYPARGSLTFRVDQIHPVGLGELLARLERLRRLLAAEGLTAPERKKRLPFLPGVVGLITGRASAAESDVLANARARWPAVRFRVENPAVQGVSAVPQIMESLARLDADPEVDVIVHGPRRRQRRGSAAVLRRGAVPGRLPCRTPVVSAIGHEPDHPIVDDVADVRCSTPTDAGKRVVPDAAAELRQVDQLRGRARRALTGWVATEQARLRRLTSATVLADPLTPIAARADGARPAARPRPRRIAASWSGSTGTWRIAGRNWPRSARRRPWPAGTRSSRPGTDRPRRSADAPAGADLRIRVADGAVLATAATERAADRDRIARRLTSTGHRARVQTSRPARRQLRTRPRRTGRGRRPAGIRWAVARRIVGALGTRRAPGRGVHPVPGRRAGAGRGCAAAQRGECGIG